MVRINGALPAAAANGGAALGARCAAEPGEPWTHKHRCSI